MGVLLRSEFSMSKLHARLQTNLGKMDAQQTTRAGCPKSCLWACAFSFGTRSGERPLVLVGRSLASGTTCLAGIDQELAENNSPNTRDVLNH